MRRIVQGLAFVAFLAFIVAMPSFAVPDRRADGWMRLSPFAGLGASVSAWELIGAFWPALVLLGGALLLGRYFCGWFCPLGTTLEIGDGVIAAAEGRSRRASQQRKALQEAGIDFEHRPARRAKYYLLVGCLAAAFVGVAAFGLFDPLSIAVRSYVLVVHAYASQGLARLLQSFGLTGAARGLNAAMVNETPSVFALHTATLAVLLGLLLLGLIRRRFWCRYLCPLGALYALAGKWAIDKRTASDACIECGRCADACPMGCISPDGHRTLNDECILCLACQPVCPTDAVRFFARTPYEQAEEVDLTRRGALTAVAAGLAAYPLYNIKPSSELAKDDPLIRPPLAGADLAAFLDKCLRCGQCMRACPTHVIQPAGLQAGIEGLWTPRLVPRLGYCIYECDSCGRACPSGAIPRFTLEEKHSAAMGLAYVDTTRCIPWRGWQRRHEEGWVADEHNCGVCEEVCPVPGKAIHFRYEYVGEEGLTGRARARGDTAGRQELRMPYVIEDRCVGCGFCESMCPLVGEAAIRVSGGFRPIPAPQTTPTAAPATALALPATTDRLRLSGTKETYEGMGELWDYINGEGEMYRPFDFVCVTAATYTDGANQVQVDLWEFKESDGAFGAFSKDRQGEPISLSPADAASTLGGSLWAWKGRFALRVVDLGETAPELTRDLGRRVFEALDAESTPPPEVCRRLPREGLLVQSVLYMRDEKPLWNLDLGANYIPEGTFGISGGAEAAYGAYDLGRQEGGSALLLVGYKNARAAQEGAQRLAELHAEWGQEQVRETPYAAFKEAERKYSVFGYTKAHLAYSASVPTVEVGEELVGMALQ